MPVAWIDDDTPVVDVAILLVEEEGTDAGGAVDEDEPLRSGSGPSLNAEIT